MRLGARYVLAALLAISVLFLLVNMMTLRTTKVKVNIPVDDYFVQKQQQEDVEREEHNRNDIMLVNPHLVEKSTKKLRRKERMVTIDYFKRFYKGMLNPKSFSPGMTGDGVKNLPSEKEREQKGFKDYSFNELASSKISLERTAPDNRQPECKKVKYPKHLPAASVIIIFHNEAWSTLLRTVHTVLARSPPQFLHEIIMVDDASLKGPEDAYSHLAKPLEDYVKTLSKVRLLRSQTRIGLTQARLLGSDNAKGEVLIFLDSHCEATNGWIEPLLAKIKEDPRRSVVPDIEVIKWEDFTFVKSGGSANRGIFNWNLHYRWGPVPPEPGQNPMARRNAATPIKSPTMAGGLFAIDRKYFYKIGAYDRGLSFWGGENMEISFKLWMCGGGIEIIQCSRVGHVFRETSPYKTPPGSMGHNSIRVAEVWLDEFKGVFYAANNGLQPEMGGDLTEQKALRQRLGCKSFRWYLENIIPELEIPDKYPLGRGDVTNIGSTSCMDNMGKDQGGSAPGLFACHKQGSNQFFIYTTKLEITFGENMCLTLHKPDDILKFWACDKQENFQKWEHVKVGEGGVIRSPVHNRCLEAVGDQILTRECDVHNRFQLWIFGSYPFEEIPPGESRTW